MNSDGNTGMESRTICMKECQIALKQCFPTILGLRHLTEYKYSLRHPVENPQ